MHIFGSVFLSTWYLLGTDIELRKQGEVVSFLTKLPVEGRKWAMMMVH